MSTNVNSSAAPTPPESDALREAFSQACQMYRHFINMRYYTFTLFSFAIAALATIFFTQLPKMADPARAGGWIKVCGGLLAAVCFVFEVCLTLAMIDYRKQIM